MATIIFGALGTALGGPVGGALGSLLGREIDRSIIGTPARAGPRLKELSVSTSSYGQPIARQFGAMRVAGTILWATDLRETSTTAGGGKSAPSTTSYSYAISLAVALSSRPIERVGRIWADGNLLRGAAGDLKTGGSMRIYTGHADQPRDPLLAAALGAQCPAHRGLAYVVFEDLQLADFGNRIPALGFEVFADGAGPDLPAGLLEGLRDATATPLPSAAPLAGFAHEGGSLGDTLAMLSDTVPLVVEGGTAGLAIAPEGDDAAAVSLPPPIAWGDGEFGTRTGTRASRGGASPPGSLRYYDTARDYQPGLQRVPGRAPSQGHIAIELPAAMSASGARALIAAAARRSRGASDRLAIRIAALAPSLRPGCKVTVPGESGAWTVRSWEWRAGGIELELERRPSGISLASFAADPGSPWVPQDRLPARTMLDAFEVPWDGAGAPDVARIMLAVGAEGGRWPGAELFVERAGALRSLGGAGTLRAVAGTLSAPLAPSPALIFEPEGALELLLDDDAAQFDSSDLPGLASGANRLLVGSEIVQFADAAPLGAGRWRLTGLLRGRGATEAEAGEGHGAGTRAVLLDARLREFGAGDLDPAHERFAAIGLAEDAPVYAEIRDPGRSRRPLPPVHPRARPDAEGGLTLTWTRRARGGWTWGELELPLIEESESYEIGAGDPAAPLEFWTSVVPRLSLTSADLSGLPPVTSLWVRQRGTFARSRPTLLATLP